MAATPWAILLCKFQDDLTEPQSRSFYEDLFTASGRGQDNLVDFYDDFSFGHVDLGGSRVLGWYTLAQARADYTGSGVNPAGRWELIGWARNAAMAAGVNLSAFSGTVVCMNVGTDLFGGGGAVCCDPGSMQVSILAQEVGHGFGLDHSRIEGSDADYQDRWDVMSTWSACFMAAHARWTLIGPGLNASNIDGRGWLDASRVWTAPATLRGSHAWANEIALRPLHRKDLAGFLAVKMAGRTFEFRVKEKWDAAIPRAAVLVHEFAYNHSYLIPSDSGSQDLGPGDVITWDRFRVEVHEIDETQQTARLLVQHVVHRRPVVGAQRVSRGVQTDGGGWVIVGGRPVRVPPRSPMARVIHHVALHELSHASPDAGIRDSGQREALHALHAHVAATIAQREKLSTPAPKLAARRKRPKKPPATKKPARKKPKS
jgi:hypothetical protein